MNRTTLLAILAIGIGTGGCDRQSSSNWRANQTHDAGSVMIEDVSQLQHTFVTHNSTWKEWAIDEVAISCGCLNITFDDSPIDPRSRPYARVGAGESLRVTMGLGIKGTGKLVENLRITWNDRREQTLSLQALAQRRMELICVPVGVEERIVQYDLDWRSQDDFPAVSLETSPPDGVSVVFGGWRKVEAGGEPSGRANRWVGKLSVDLSGYEGDWPIEVEVRTEDGAEARIAITGR